MNRIPVLGEILMNKIVLMNNKANKIVMKVIVNNFLYKSHREDHFEGEKNNLILKIAKVLQ